MNLYLISQKETDYDTFDSAVVCAENKVEAGRIHPNEDVIGEWWIKQNYVNDVWASHPDNVSVELIGEAASHMEKGVVLASFNAG